MRYLCVILLPTYIDIVVLFDFSKVLAGEYYYYMSLLYVSP
jgi:hypothetical protein